MRRRIPAERESIDRESNNQESLDRDSNNQESLDRESNNQESLDRDSTDRSLPTPRPRSSRPLLAWVAVPIVLGWILLPTLGCHVSTPTTGPKPVAEGAVDSPEVELRRVEVVTARRGVVRDTLTLSTTLEAHRTVEIPTWVQGRVSEVLVRPGERVGADDVLLRLDPREQELAARELELAHRDAVER